MKGIITKILSYLFTLFLFFSVNNVVLAASAVYFQDNGGSSGGGYNGRGGGNGSYATWNGSNGNVLGYRITLVESSGEKAYKVESDSFEYARDADGNMIPTNSVDVVNSNGNEYYVISYPNKPSLGANLLFGGDDNTPYYKYRFADRVRGSSSSYASITPVPNSYGSSNISKYKFLAIPGFPTKSSELEGFIYNNIISINTTDLVHHSDPSIYKYPAVWHGADTNIKVDFVSYILHLMGYLSDTDNDYFEKNTYQAGALNNKYLIFEPLYRISYNGKSSYGTATEIVTVMKDGINQSGNSDHRKILNGLWGTAEVSKMACGSYDKNSNLVPTRMDSADCWSHYYCNAGHNFSHGCPNGSNDIVYNMLDLNWGFGYRPVSMNFAMTITTPRPEVHTAYSYFTIDLCKSNDFYLYYRINGNNRWNNVKESMRNSDFLITEGGPDDNSVYCFDEATYDFSDILSALRDPHTIFTDVDIPRGNLSVLRTCYSEHGEPNFDLKVKNSYFNNYFKLHVYGKNYVLKVDQESFSGEEQPAWETDSTGRKIIRRYKANFEYILTDNFDSNTAINSINLDYDTFQRSDGVGYLDFSHAYDTTNPNYSTVSGLFGASNKLVNMFYNEGSSELNYSLGINNYFRNYQLFYNDGDMFDGSKSPVVSNMRCDFNYELENIDPQIDFEFRTVSLDYPFPARDGSSRLSGRNWLDEENKVYEYITNNRGIRYQYYINHDDVSVSDVKKMNLSPEKMYEEVEPMYTITLTPSTMQKIRDYNKLFDYRSMYSSNTDSRLDHLRCKDDGTQCYSEFLRDSRYIPQDDINGDCVLIKNTLDGTSIRNTLNLSDGYDYALINNKVQTYIDNYIAVENNFALRGTSDFDSKKEEKYYSAADLNKNLRLDQNDIEIAKPSHAGMNTKYYTCANKTFYSGGPVNE